MSLKEILTSIHEAEAEIAMDPSQVDPRVRSMAEARVRNATDRVKELKNQYRSTLLSSILVVKLVGDGAAKFAEIARSKWSVLTYDHKDIALGLTDAVKSRGGNSEEFTSNDGFLLQSELLNVKNSYGLAHMPPLFINEISPTVFGAKPIAAVQRILEFSYGPGLYDTHTLRLAQHEALQAKFSGNVIPIFLHNYYEEKPEQRILPGAQFTIEVNSKTPTVKFVQEQIMSIKQKLSPKTETTEATEKTAVNS